MRLVWLLAFSALGWCQSNPILVREAGRVHVAIAGLSLEADAGVQNPKNTQVIELHGHILIRLPEGPPFWVLRCGPGQVIVANDPVTIAADELSLKGGMLHVRGHIQIKRDFTVLQAEEADFYLKAGEAEVRGNILVNGSSPGPSSPSRRMGDRFPPDVVVQ